MKLYFYFHLGVIYMTLAVNQSRAASKILGKMADKGITISPSLTDAVQESTSQLKSIKFDFLL